MCPNECPGLQDVYGEEFNELYRTYVAQGRFKKVVKARADLGRDSQVPD